MVSSSAAVVCSAVILLQQADCTTIDTHLSYRMHDHLPFETTPAGQVGLNAVVGGNCWEAAFTCLKGSVNATCRKQKMGLSAFCRGEYSLT